MLDRLDRIIVAIGRGLVAAILDGFATYAACEHATLPEQRRR